MLESFLRILREAGHWQDFIRPGTGQVDPWGLLPLGIAASATSHHIKHLTNMRQDADSPQGDNTPGRDTGRPSGEPVESIEASASAEPRPSPEGDSQTAAVDQDFAGKPGEIGSEPVLDQGANAGGETTTEASSVRVGSPFAEDPFEADESRPIENLYDVGPVKYTAMGAVTASVLVLGFAAAAAYLFPAGGTMVAALGCLLSIFGMYSPWRLASAGLLAVHLCLFLLSYGRTMT